MAPAGETGTQRRVLLIVNPQAGGGRARQRWERMRTLLDGRMYDVAVTQRVGDAARIAQDSAAEYDTIAAVGGDGTMNEVLNGLLLSQSARPALAMLPLGTGNDLALQLGLDNWSTAVQTAFVGQRSAVDVIDVECRDERGEPKRFSALMYVAVGLAGEMGRLTTPWLKRTLGARWSYTIGFLRTLIRHPFGVMRVQVDDAVFEGPRHLVAVGNVEWVGGQSLRLFPGARFDDGQMEVNLVSQLSRWETLRCFDRARVGSHPAHPKVTYRSARHVTIESDPALPLNFDGEVAALTPVTLTLRPRAVAVRRNIPQ